MLNLKNGRYVLSIKNQQADISVLPKYSDIVTKLDVLFPVFLVTKDTGAGVCKYKS